MKTIKIGEKEYTLEFTFEAAEHKDLVQSMFNVVSGAYITKRGLSDNLEIEKERVAAALLDGTAEMIGDMPRICRIGFYAGLLENNPVSEDEAKKLMKQYMKENQLSFSTLYDELKQCMEDDNFFVLSGIQDMIQKMSSAAEEKTKTVRKTKSAKSTGTN